MLCKERRTGHINSVSLDGRFEVTPTRFFNHVCRSDVAVLIAHPGRHRICTVRVRQETRTMAPVGCWGAVHGVSVLRHQPGVAGGNWRGHRSHPVVRDPARLVAWSVGGAYQSTCLHDRKRMIFRSKRNQRPSWEPSIRCSRSVGPPGALAVNDTRLRYGGACVSWRSTSASSW